MRITGASILLMVDNIHKKHSVKIIDLSSCEELEDETKRDDGFILGIKSLLAFLEKLSVEKS